MTKRILAKTCDFRRAGYIYIIEADDKEHVKIGRSRAPEQRISALRGQAGVSSKSRTFVSLHMCDSHTAEKRIFSDLAIRRTAGEWFHVSFERAVETVTRYLGEEVDETMYKEWLINCETEAEKKTDKLLKEMLPRFSDANSSDAKIMAPIKVITTLFSRYIANELPLSNEQLHRIQQAIFVEMKRFRKQRLEDLIKPRLFQ